MTVDLDLVRLHLRIRLPDPRGEPFQQVGLTLRSLRGIDVERQVDVVEGFQCGALGQTSGEQRLDKAVIRVVGGVLVELLPESADLLAVIRDILALEVDRFVREGGNVRVPDLRAG